MKKSILMLAVAGMVMASCANEETVKVTDSRAIGFESFVGKSTRAVNDLVSNDGSFTKFFVYGSYENGGSYVPVYNGEFVSNETGAWVNDKIQYWVAGKTYKFAAYSNGNETVAGVSFANDGSLTILNYTVGDKDLIAVNNVEQTGAESGNKAVPLVFKHLLSKVKFTFKTTYNADLTVTVSNLKFNAANVGTWNGTWTPGTAADKIYGNVTATSAGAASEECYVLPQANTALVASFTVTVTDAGKNKIAEKDFTGVKLDAGDAWNPGYAYNYTAIIKPENMTDGETTSEAIVFNPSVDPWQNGSVTDDDILNE